MVRVRRGAWHTLNAATVAEGGLAEGCGTSQGDGTRLARLHSCGVWRVAWALVFGLVLAPPVWAQPPQYTVVVLTIGNTAESHAYGINASGQVVGWARVDCCATRAVLWGNGTLTDLGSLAGNYNVGESINDNGQIAGHSTYVQSRAFLWDGGALTDLSASSKQIPSTQAHGISASGQVVGEISYVLTPGLRTTRATLWQNGTMTELAAFGDTTCSICAKDDKAWAINARGQIVGSAEMPYIRACLWQDGTMNDLGTLGGDTSTAFGINAHGQIVGWAQTAFAAPTYGRHRAFLWGNGTMTNLGTLGDSSSASTAYGINASAWVVGSVVQQDGSQRGFLWLNGGMHDLNALVDTSEWTILEARAINDAGQIAATGRLNGGPERALLLIPSFPPPPAPVDTDDDALPDEWETQFGLSASSSAAADGASGDPDGDGLTNLQEFQQQSHPRGTFIRFLAEGATGFFDARIALLNPGAEPRAVLLRFLKNDGQLVSHFVSVAAQRRETVDAKDLAGLGAAEFSTVVEADGEVVVDRTMTWDQRGYGSHAETAVQSPASTWYLAEGATHSGFDLFYLLQNANAVASNVQVTYLLPAPAAPVVKSYVVPAQSRFTIWVDLIPELADTDVSAIVTSTNNTPLIVERAMYLDAQGLPFGAGHESAGVTAPATNWFLAEGATGSFFDLFVLIANPTETDTAVTATYYLPTGHVFFKTYSVRANSRFNIWVDLEDPLLADTAVSIVLSTTGGVPVIVERSMWWPGSSATWHEAHNSPGATATSAAWALAEGEVSTDARAVQTYILLAKPSAGPANIKVTLLLEGGGTLEKTYTVTGNSRFNVSVRDEFPGAINQRFGALVETLDGSQIVVERAMYSNAEGVVWAAGTNALGTPLATLESTP